MNILVVEDDPSVRDTLGMVLESCGHEAKLVKNGEQALERLKNEWPDVMLLDLTLPGMSGEEVFQAVLNAFGRIPPTIVVSAAQQGAKRASSMLGALFLAKPYTIEELEDIIQEAARIRAA